MWRRQVRDSSVGEEVGRVKDEVVGQVKGVAHKVESVVGQVGK